jgi:hypothetical protein
MKTTRKVFKDLDTGLTIAILEPPFCHPKTLESVEVQVHGLPARKIVTTDHLPSTANR